MGFAPDGRIGILVGNNIFPQSCGPNCPSAISDSEGAAQRRRHKNNQKKNSCPTDSCPHSKTN